MYRVTKDIEHNKSLSFGGGGGGGEWLLPQLVFSVTKYSFRSFCLERGSISGSCSRFIIN